MLGNIRKHTLGEAAAIQPAKKPRAYDESDDQKRVVNWIRKADGNWLVMRMENAAKRTAAQAARDMLLGMEPGAPDLIVSFRTFSFYLEMKTITGKVSDTQTKLHKELRARGNIVMIGWGHERTIAALESMAVCWSHYSDNETLLIGGLRSIIERASLK